MRFLKNLYDQFFTAGRLTKQFCQDPVFAERIGFDGVPKREHILRLKQHIGFVLAMYNVARAIFEKHSDMDTDAKLVLLMISRFRLLPALPDPEELSLRYIEELKLTDGWSRSDVKKKFFDVCRCVFAEEMKRTMKPMAVNAFFAEDEVIEQLSESIISVVLAAIFEAIPWEIREDQRSYSGERRWSRFTASFVTVLSRFSK